MKLFNIEDGIVEVVQSLPFKLEKDIQSLVESNTEKLFNLKFIQTELTVDKYRLDSLCYDEENNSFVIIEYKKGSSYSVIDQGYTYLQLLLNNKSEFLLILSQHFNKVLNMKDVDWSQSRIIFVSPSFNSYQKDSVNFRDLPFELWEIKRYSNNSIILNQHKSSSNESVESLTNKNTKSVIKSVNKEVKVYTEDYLLTKSERNERLLDFYKNIKERISEWGEYEILPNGKFLKFKSVNTFISIIFYGKNKIGLILNVPNGKLNDSKNTFELTLTSHWGEGDYSLWLDTTLQYDFEDIMLGVYQSYKMNS
jgi:hypothetical protein